MINAAVAQATSALPHLPRDEDGPVFREPWEAQAFAMALSLHERGLFTWNEWAAALADEIKRAQAAGDPDHGQSVGIVQCHSESQNRQLPGTQCSGVPFSPGKVQAH